MNSDTALNTPMIFLVEDNVQVRKVVRAHLEKDGYSAVEELDCGKALRSLLKQKQPGVILLDIKLPDCGDVSLLKEIKNNFPDIPVIMITGYGTIDTAVECMKLGAHHFLTKPLDFSRLSIAVRTALAQSHHSEKVTEHQSGYGRHRFDDLIGSGPSMQTMYQVIETVSASDATVFITGESGTGKELVARSIHSRSRRAEGPMIPINCSAIPHELLESELFGHEKGAFTSAIDRHIGCCEAADGGTLFLDEICEMPLKLQVKLLRFLQERSFQRVGGRRTIKVDVRIIAATNRDPIEEVGEGRFREDIYYRLFVIPIEIPPLRSRKEDIPLLAKHFLETFSSKNKKRFKRFSPEAIKFLINYSWPGNVRELENTIESIIVLHDRTAIEPKHLPQKILEYRPQPQRSHPPRSVIDEPSDHDDAILPLAEVEKQTIIRTIRICEGNIAETARKLDLSPTTVYRKIKEYNIKT